MYQPTIGAIGISQPWEITTRVTGPGRMVTGEMSAREGALAAQWLNLQTVLPCHYIDPDNNDVREFNEYLERAKARGERVPASVVMKPGEILSI